MLGLFSTLNLGARSLQAQQTAVEVTGQNLANVNNPAYARQRVQIQTSPAVPGSIGLQGTGAQAVAIQQLRDQLVDNQIRNEESVGGYWSAKQSALQNAQASLGEFIDRNADALNGVSTGGGVSSGLADDIGNLFNGFQKVSASPTSDAQRKGLMDAASALTLRLNQTSQRLGELGKSMNQTLGEDVASANQLIADIAKLNDSIMTSELGQTGMANDLRDRRVEKLEALGQLVNYNAVENANGTVDISIDGVTMLSVNEVQETLETFDAGGGQMLVRAATAGTPLNLTSGALQGTIDARDGALKDLRAGLDTLANTLITDVNAVHRAGFSLTGSTGEDFFTGTNAADIGVNAALKDNPALFQAAGVSGENGANSVALALAQLARDGRAALNGQTFSDSYGGMVANLGHELNITNGQLAEHDAVAAMLERQRASVSGVSIDEEMSDLVRFQHAYEASARIISTVDQMIQTVLSMKQ